MQRQRAFVSGVLRSVVRSKKKSTKSCVTPSRSCFRIILMVLRLASKSTRIVFSALGAALSSTAAHFVRRRRACRASGGLALKPDILRQRGTRMRSLRENGWTDYQARLGV